jgi:predicted dehydrogenase
MIKMAEKNNVRLLYGITRRYTGFAQSIDKIFKTHCGDEVLFISITGGAQCAITTGIHWFDFASELLNDSPLEVFATLKNGMINPRNINLGFWEGVITWKFRNSKFVNMVYSNSSFGRTKVQIYGKNGYLLLDPAKKVDVFGIVPSGQELPSKITRTVDFDFIESVNLSDLNLPNPFERQIEILIGVEPMSYDLPNILKIFTSFMAALISNEENRPIDLPIKSLNPYYYKLWPVS